MEEQQKPLWAEQDERLLGLLEEIRDNTAAQRLYAQKQYRLSCIHTAAVLAVLVCLLAAVLSLAPRVERILSRADAVLADMEQVSAGLAAADIPGMIARIDALVGQTSAGVDQALLDLDSALQPLEQVDIESLNEAIRDLRSVVAPMANLFGG